MIEIEIFKPSKELEEAIENFWPFKHFYLLGGDTTLIECTHYINEPSGNVCLILNIGYIKVQLYIPAGSYSIIRRVKL